MRDSTRPTTARVVQCRVFTLNHDQLLADIVESVLGLQEESIKPGSKEFHALKRGHDLNGGSDIGTGKGKGKGKGRK